MSDERDAWWAPVTGAHTAGPLFPPYTPHGFWKALTPADREEILRIGRSETYPVGAVLMRQRQHADRVVVIFSGLAKICVAKGFSQEIVAFRGAGDLIGERAMFALRRRSASAIAVTDVGCVVIPGERFEDFPSRRPALRRELEEQIYDRLGEGRAAREADAEAGLATMIADLYARTGFGDGGDGRFSLHLSPGELAGWAGMRERDAVPILDAWWFSGVLGEYRRRLGDVDLRRLVQRGGYVTRQANRPKEEWHLLNCSIMFVDIAGSSDPVRNDADHALITEVMYEILRDAYDASGIPWSEVRPEDRGDGALIIVPPPFPTCRLVDPLLPRLALSLRRHNRRAGAPIRIQLRVAIHAGPVTSRAHGVSSEAVTMAARLVDAAPLKKRIADTGANLGVICSDHAYRSAVRQASEGVDPGRYERVDVQVKELAAPAWIYVSDPPVPVGRPLPPGDQIDGGTT